MNDELPEGWASAPVADVASRVVVGYVGPSRQHYVSSGIPFLMGKNIRANRVLLNDLERVTPEFHRREKKSQLSPNDVVVVRIGRSGTAVVIPESLGPANCGGLVIVKKPMAVLPSYLAYYLNSPKGQQASIAEARGVTRQTLNTKSVEAALIPLAPMDEQRRIVAKLEGVLSRVDAAQARLATIPRILKRFRQSVLAAACSGRLTAVWRKENPRKESASRMLRNLRITTGQCEELNGLPQTWAMCKFGDYVENFDGRRIPVESKERKKRNGPYPYYGASGMIDSINSFTHDGNFLLIGEDGANLLARSKPIAFLASGKIWVNNHAHVLKCKAALPNEYLGHYINSIDLQPYVTGSAQPKLTQTNMNRISVPVPPLTEQQEIVRRVEALFKTADALEARYRRAKAHVDKLTQSILAKAFRGELVPQDPNDEPASALLERIRAKRNGTGGKKRGRK